MEGFTLWSYIALWVLVLLQAALLVGTLRQVGQLWLRLGPETPLDKPTEVTIGRQFDVDWLPASDGVRRLLLFISPTCGVCEQVLSGLRRRLHREDQLVLVCQASEEDCRAYVDRHGLLSYPVVVDPDGSRIAAAKVGDIPFAVLLDGDDMTERTAIVNSPKQVETILRAAEANVA